MTNRNIKWTLDNILSGIIQFNTEYGRYPTAEDFDVSSYLPSARQIQRRFGGLVGLRNHLGFDIKDYGSGLARSKVSLEVGKRGSEAERIMELELVKHFGEHFVHCEKPLYKYYNKNDSNQLIGKSRADFFVYHAKGIFCVDVFVARNIFTLKRIINVKSPTYTNLNVKVYFVNGGIPSLATQKEIENYCKNKAKQLDNNLEVLNMAEFIDHIKSIKPLNVQNS